jgi:hypothetical protein
LKPALHAQVKEPAVLVQVALAWQLCVPAVHSLTSAQLTPLPLNPELHAQLKPPWVSVQVALAWQLWVPRAHSLTSPQVLPSPA